MAVDMHHEEYDAMRFKWRRIRDFLEGEEAVRKAGEVYLPRLEGQTEEQYQKYRDRGVFLNATSRTHLGMTGLVFVKDPKFILKGGIEDLEEDSDLSSTSLYHATKTAVYETVAMGRYGTLVDWSEEENRPYFVSYRTEDIINWRYRKIGGKIRLSLLALREWAGGDPVEESNLGEEIDGNSDAAFIDQKEERIRLLRLLIGENGEPFYRAELWVQVSDEDSGKKTKRSKWVMQDSWVPTRRGMPLTEIPFVFHSSSQMARTIPQPPLDDLASLNVTHYKLSADHYHGLHFTALPTAWVAGFDEKTELKLGSQSAWISENTDAKAGFLEFTGAGLGAIRAELDRLEKMMVIMGARMLEQPKREAETAEAIRLQAAGESALLMGIVTSVSETMTDVLKWCSWWANPSIGHPDDVTPEQALVEINTDFSVAMLGPQELQAIVSSWIQGAISRRTLFEKLKQGEIIPPDRTYEEEQELIDEDAARMAVSGGQEDEDGY